MRPRLPQLFLLAVILGAAHLPWASAASQPSDKPAETSPPSPSDDPKDWGIEIVGVRLTGAGHFLDFRYRVVDPEKSKALLDRDQTVYLLDQATGTRIEVPVTKVGPIRQTTRRPEKDRIYVVLFGNPGKIVKPGSRVTVVMGDFRAVDLEVQ